MWLRRFTVTGDGSVWDNAEFLGVGGYVFGGSDQASGSAVVTVENGGNLTVGENAIIFGRVSGAHRGSTVVVDDGTVAIGKKLRIDGTLDIRNGGIVDFGIIAGSGNVIVDDTSTFTADNFSLDSTQQFNGVISGAGALIKGGSGTLTLGGKNTYTGTTTISGQMAQSRKTSLDPDDASLVRLRFCWASEAESWTSSRRMKAINTRKTSSTVSALPICTASLHRPRRPSYPAKLPGRDTNLAEWWLRCMQNFSEVVDLSPPCALREKN